jgi:hypothetical protein
VVDQAWQVGEEASEPVGVTKIERRDARSKVEADAVSPIGSRAVRITSAPASRARRAVSSPIPELPPRMTTI